MRRTDIGERWERAVVALVIPIVAIAIRTGALDAAGIVKWWLLVALSAVLVALWAAALWRTGTWRVPDRVFLAVVGVYLLSLALTVLMAEETVRAVLGTYGRWTGAGAYAAGAVFAVAAARTIDRPEHRVTLARVIVGTGAFVALYSIAQRLGFDPIRWVIVFPDKAFATLGNPNFASAFQGVTVPLALWGLADRRRSRLERQIHLGVLVLLMLGQFATGSMIGLFASAVGLAVWFGLTRLTSNGVRDRLGLAVLGATSVGGAAALFGWILDLLPAPHPVAIRIFYWRAAADMFVADPVLGVGLGRFDDWFRRARPAELVPEFGYGAIADNPHSVIMTLLAEGGLLVVMPYLAFVAVVGWRLLGAVRSGDRSGVVPAIGAAWVASFVQAMVNFDVPPLLVLSMVLGGAVVALDSNAVELRVALPTAIARSGAILAALVSVAIAFVAVTPVSADSDANTALAAVETDRSESAAQLAAIADRAWWEPRYRFHAAQQAFIAGEADRSLNQALRGVASFDSNWEMVLITARIAVEVGDTAEASRWYDRALVIDPYDPAVRAEYGEYLLSTGDPAGAIPLIQEAVDRRPARGDWQRLLDQAARAQGQKGKEEDG